MTLIEQIEGLEDYVMKRLAPVQRNRFFKDVGFFKGWGEFVPNKDGDQEPEWMSTPSVEVVGNESSPNDDSSRSITLRVTVTSAQSEGPTVHRNREKAIDKALGKANRADAEKRVGTFTRWRWTIIRLITPETYFETEWTLSVGMDYDPNWEC